MAERKYWEIDSAISSSYQYIYENGESPVPAAYMVRYCAGEGGRGVSKGARWGMGKGGSLGGEGDKIPSTKAIHGICKEHHIWPSLGGIKGVWRPRGY